VEGSPASFDDPGFQLSPSSTGTVTTGPRRRKTNPCFRTLPDDADVRSWSRIRRVEIPLRLQTPSRWPGWS